MLKLPIIQPNELIQGCQSHRNLEKKKKAQELHISLKKRTMMQLDQKSVRTTKSSKSRRNLNIIKAVSVKHIDTFSNSAASTAPYSNASAEVIDGGFEDVTSCYLKTSSNKFKKYQLAVIEDQLNFYKPESEESIRIEKPRASHSLDNVHVTCGAIE